MGQVEAREGNINGRKSNMRHTLEPWKVAGPSIKPVQGKSIPIVEIPQYLRSEKAREIGDANLLRIIVCVNACEGISNAVLERDATKELFRALAKLSSEAKLKELDPLLEKAKSVLVKTGVKKA
jgi:hypothetical protein